MTSKEFFTHLYNLICILIAGVSELSADANFLALVPPKYKHAVAVISLVAMAAKSRSNLLAPPPAASSDQAAMKQAASKNTPQP